MRRKGRITIPHGQTQLRLGDVVLAVGTDEALEKVHQLLGNETHEDMENDPSVEARQIVITNPSIHNVNLDHLGISHCYNVVIARIWRSGIEFTPASDFNVQLGDSVLAVGRKMNLDRLVSFLGKREKTLGEVDFLSMAFGIAIGIILGKITFSIPGLGKVDLGSSGGVLLVGLFLGYVRRLGFITGQMSPSAKTILKEIGLVFLLAGLGIQSGNGLPGIKIDMAATILLSSLFLLLFSSTAVFIMGYKVLKMGLLRSIACLCGGLISSTALSTLMDMSKSDEPAAEFASCYPITTVGVILTSQVLSAILTLK